VAGLVITCQPGHRLNALPQRRELELTVTDLHPGMKIEVTAARVSKPSLADRPSWLADSAQWPPQPGEVMYMIADSSVGICDQCITQTKEVEKLVAQYGGKKVVERGDTSWYCSVRFKSATRDCQRHWNGYSYDKPGRY
jgi:hypothetical protein